ncbi:MAG: NAD(P)/FAD-dependent oxidoreductase, partial [Candidatus Bathyarchaeia archaeon]
MNSILIVGAGILGSTVAYWLSSLYDVSITVLEKEAGPALHTSGRNTGVIHQPFYLNPVTKRIFAKSARVSYEKCWKQFAKLRNLPWREVGTLKVAISDEHVSSLETYKRWGLENGMNEVELELLDGKQVKELEPNVECLAALYCKTETAVSYQVFTNEIKKDAELNGAKFLPNSEVKKIDNRKGRLSVSVKGLSKPMECDFLINCAGGNSVDIAHMMDIGKEFEDLHFRGEYLVVDPRFDTLCTRNIYSVPKYQKYPFLDPHFIVRADGRREVGPNAVLVGSPTDYAGIPFSLFLKLLERPISRKLRLLFDVEFLSLVREEWKSSFSKNEMANRVRKFLPKLKTEYLTSMGLAGIRSSVMGRYGFEPEAIELEGPNSYH